MAVPTAKQAWKKRIDGTFHGSFLDVVRGLVVCKVLRDRVPVIWCLHSNGKTAWERDFADEELDVYFPHADSIYVDGGRARKLDIETGQIVAERDLGDVVAIRPPILSGPVYILGGFGEPTALLGLDPETLEVAWRWPDPDYVAHDGRLCRYFDGKIHIVDLKTFEEREIAYPRALGYHGHCGDLWCHFEGRERLAISTTTGELVWRHEEPASGFHDEARFANDVAYCRGPALSAYDLRTGALLWRQEVEGNPGRLRVEGGRLYAGTKAGVVYMLDARTGKVLLTHDLKVEPTAIAPLAPNRIVVGTYKVIYCLETE